MRMCGCLIVIEDCERCFKLDLRVKSAASGKCLVCGKNLNCEQGCYDPALYKDDTVSNVALEQGVCVRCGGPVDCSGGHLKQNKLTREEQGNGRDDDDGGRKVPAGLF